MFGRLVGQHRGLAHLGWAWRRPRLVVGLTDPDYDQRIQAICDLLTSLPEYETALFQDEVDALSRKTAVRSARSPPASEAEKPATEVAAACDS